MNHQKNGRHKKNKLKDENGKNKLKDFNAKSSSHVAALPEEKNFVLEQKEKIPLSAKTPSKDDISEADRIYILKNINKTDYLRSDRDSLFEIVDKAYKRSGYKKVLAP